MKKVLIIQTAFIGDVVLATSLIESIHASGPAQIDFLVRKGNEGLLQDHPFLHEVIIWNKKEHKYKNWFSILNKIRRNKYDAVINVQRYAATGIWTALSNATLKIGFQNNPMAFLFTHKMPHQMLDHTHEIQRNFTLLSPLGIHELQRPKLYPSQKDFSVVAKFQKEPYITIAPSSVWYTKQFPSPQWVAFLQQIPFKGPIYLIGAKTDHSFISEIILASQNKQCVNLAGQLSLLESAALQSTAVLNYVNDSAPMHFASSMNAPVVAIYCSTIPAFGYGPLSDNSTIVESTTKLNCRPCGLHGKNACPYSHFNCAMTISMDQLNAALLQLQKQL